MTDQCCMMSNCKDTSCVGWFCAKHNTLWGAKWAKSPVIGKIWISFFCHARVVNLLITISTQCFGMYLSNWKAKIHVYLHDKIAYFQFFQKNLNFILEDNCFVRGWTSQLRPVAGDISSIASIQHPVGHK